MKVISKMSGRRPCGTNINDFIKIVTHGCLSNLLRICLPGPWILKSSCLFKSSTWICRFRWENISSLVKSSSNQRTQLERQAQLDNGAGMSNQGGKLKFQLENLKPQTQLEFPQTNWTFKLSFTTGGAPPFWGSGIGQDPKRTKTVSL